MRLGMRALAGALIGIGCVMPGVSGGLMAVSFGLYRPALDALLGFFGDARRNLRFLLPLAAGGAAGYFAGAAALGGLMRSCPEATLFLFVGLIVGGVPGVVRKGNAGGFRPRYLLALAAGLALSMGLAALPARGAAQALNGWQALLSGVIQGVGTVAPGVSGSFVMIRLGWYQAFLAAVTALEWKTLALIALGFGASALAMMRIVKRAFDRAPNESYYGVLGFLLGTTCLVVPPLGAGTAALARLGALALGLAGALMMSRLGESR